MRSFYYEQLGNGPFDSRRIEVWFRYSFKLCKMSNIVAKIILTKRFYMVKTSSAMWWDPRSPLYPREGSLLPVVKTSLNCFYFFKSFLIVACFCQEPLRLSFRAVGRVVRSAGKFKDETDVSQP